MRNSSVLTMPFEGDARPLAARRRPREFFADTTDLGAALDGPTPPLALSADEVEAIVGRPPSDWTTGEGYEPGFGGMRSFSREHHLAYRRPDGCVLTYAWEGALAYALQGVSR
jgi:hypothetical protein